MRKVVFIAMILAALQLAARAQTAPTEVKPDAEVKPDLDADQAPTAKEDPKDKDAPKTPAEHIEQQRAAQKKDIEQNNTNLPVVSVKRVEDAIQMRLENGQLVAKTSVPESDSQVKLDVPGYGGFTTILVQGKTGNGMSEAKNIQFEHWDFGTPGTISIHTSISAMGGNVNIFRGSESLGSESSVQLIQNFTLNEDRTVWLHVQKSNANGRMPVNLHLPAPSISDPRRLYPHETAEYLQPVFRDIGQEAAVFSVDPRIGWQVFADAYKPTDEQRGKVEQIIKQLDADNFQDRQKASEALGAMGEPAAMVLAKTERSKLSAEQNGRIDSFLASYLPLSPAEADTLRSKPDFLLDCLYTTDPFVRAQALAQLEKVSGKTLDFDSTLEGESRFDAIAKLRAQLNLGPTTQPSSTQP